MPATRRYTRSAHAVSDIVIGHLAYEKAREQSVGMRLSYDSAPRDM